jgi:DNA-binding NarL/FixJ family response regulator
MINVVSDLPIRILLVCTDARTCARLRGVIARLDAIELVGEAASAERAAHRSRRQAPDIGLVSLNLAPAALAAPWSGSSPAPRWIVLAASCNSDAVVDALARGASGCITVTAQPAALLRAVVTVHRGGAHLDPALTARLFDAYVVAPAHRRDSRREPGR